MSGVNQPEITTSCCALAQYLHSFDLLGHQSFFAGMRQTTTQATSSLNGDECK